MQGISPAIVHNNPFSDVPADAYYRTALEWAAANGIISGIGGGLFAPDANITRQDLALNLMRYAAFANIQIPVTRQYTAFADEDKIAPYAKEAVEALYCGGIVSGKPGGLFDPQGSATRAKVAATLHRFLEAIDK
jgi:hypothetical protein